MENKTLKGIAVAGAIAIAPMFALAPMALAQTGASPGGAAAQDPEPGRTADRAQDGLVTGSTGFAGAMPMADVEMGLQQAGFTDFEVVEYTVRGMRNGQPVTVRVDATTGQVIE